MIEAAGHTILPSADLQDELERAQRKVRELRTLLRLAIKFENLREAQGSSRETRSNGPVAVAVETEGNS